MSVEKKDETKAAEQEGVDANDADAVRGQKGKSAEQQELSEEQLDDAAGGTSGDISRWDVSRVTTMKSTK